MTRRSLSRVALMTALTAVSAWLIPPFALPGIPVSFTFQTLFIFFAGYLLPAKEAFLSIAAYVLLGAAGLPVFSGGRGGLDVLLGPTGGFLWLFPFVSAGIAATIRPGDRLLRRTAAGVLFGIVLFYPPAVLWTSFAADLPYLAVLTGMLPYAVFDVLKVVVAEGLSRRIARALSIPE